MLAGGTAVWTRWRDRYWRERRCLRAGLGPCVLAEHLLPAQWVQQPAVLLLPERGFGLEFGEARISPRLVALVRVQPVQLLLLACSAPRYCCYCPARAVAPGGILSHHSGSFLLWRRIAQRSHRMVSRDPMLNRCWTRTQAPDGEVSSSVAGARKDVPLSSCHATSATAHITLRGSIVR